MTRAAEFCYIAEHRDGPFLQAFTASDKVVWFTADPEEALRITEAGRTSVAKAIMDRGFGAIGFRKILVG